MTAHRTLAIGLSLLLGLLPGDLPAQVLELISPNSKTGGRFGAAISAVPDADSDGLGDIVVGAPGEDAAGTKQHSGSATIFSGATGAALRVLLSPDDEEEERFGMLVAGLTDVNGDGRGDVAVGTASGQVHIYSGSSGSLHATLDSPDPEYALFGRSISGIADADGDGRGDIAVGGGGKEWRPPEPPRPPEGAPRAYLFSGKTGALLRTLISPQDGAALSVAGVPDVDGDGRGDVVAGQQGFRGIGTTNPVEGAHVFSGATGALLRTLAVPAGTTKFGAAVAGIADVNGDGRGDVLVGARGQVHVFSGGTGALIRTLAPAGASELNLMQVSAMGDANGDGRSDIVIGTPGADPAPGRAHVFSGASGLLLYTFTSPNPESKGSHTFGQAVAGLPGPGGNGPGSLGVGAPLQDIGEAVTHVQQAPPPGVPQQPVETHHPSVGRAYLFSLRDDDGDGVPGAVDNCPELANAGQADGDQDGVGNACDNCPGVKNEGQADADQDGRGNACDNCPLRTNPAQEDADGDGDGDACDNCPGAANRDQEDFDGDGAGDACDDSDGDGVADAADNCPEMANPSQADQNGNGIGDPCEDTDGDGIAHSADNCPGVANPGQADGDGDGDGDACDNCPQKSNRDQADADGDLAGDACDSCPLTFQPAAAFQLLAPASLGLEARSMSGVPDADGDGHSDFVVGVGSYSPTKGFSDRRAFVYSAVGRQLYRLESQRQLSFGWSVSGMPDADGDGRGDMVIGAPGENRAYVVSGATGGFLHTLERGHPGDSFFGQAVAGIPDADGDGRGDVVVASLGARNPLNQETYAVRASVLSGATGAAISEFSPEGVYVQSSPGAAILAAIPRSGRVVLGAAGAAHVFSAADGAPAYVLSLPNLRGISGVPDVDADGQGDVAAAVAGAPNQAHVFSSATGALLHTLLPPAGASDFGAAVAGIADSDSDGHGDVLVGAFNKAFLFSGGTGEFIRAVTQPAGVVFKGPISGAPLSGADTVGAAIIARQVSVSTGQAAIAQLVYLEPDCNGNGSSDACDIALESSADCSLNGIPDECEPDCDRNGIADSCDIASGTSLDCDRNRVPDACDIAAGEKPDCNRNGVPDSCDIAGDTSVDLDADGAPDECSGLVFNVSRGTNHPTLSGAILGAAPGDELLALLEQAFAEPRIDFARKPLTLSSRGSILVPEGGSLRLADDSVLRAAPGGEVFLGGDLLAGAGARVHIDCRTFVLDGSGTMTVPAAAFFDVEARSGARLLGGALVEPFGTLAFTSRLENSGTLVLDGGALVAAAIVNSGRLEVYDGKVSAAALTVAEDGVLFGTGDIFADLVNDGEAVFIADSLIKGDATNSGTLTAQAGTVTITGSMTNDGAMVGGAGGGAGGGGEADRGGMTVLGDYAAGAGGSLILPSPRSALKVGGDFDVAIADPARFDLSRSTLQLVGMEGIQRVEVLSSDIGAAVEGRLVPYPLGALRIGPTPAAVELVDHHDQDGLGQEAPEALYVDALTIDAGAALITNGHVVYYRTLVLDGEVDAPANLVPIGSSSPRFRRGDSNADGKVNISDPIRTLGFLFLGAADPPCLDAADADDDGRINITDPIYTLNFLFTGGRPIPPPGTTTCGEDRTADTLGQCVYPGDSCR